MREGLAASHKWIQEHGDQYRGLWVIVDDGQLLGAGSKLDKLKEQLGSFGGAIVTKIASIDCRCKGGDMGWKYRAVEWRSHDPDYDEVFMSHRAKLIAEGWEEHLRASWRPSLTGGALIMRRPKDEPEEKLSFRQMLGVIGHHRGEQRPKDEPRMWTVKEVVAAWSEYLPTMRNPDEELQKRNAELQAAIDEVAQIATQGGEYRAVPTLQAVRRLLYPLVTKKEESND